VHLKEKEFHPFLDTRALLEKVWEVMEFGSTTALRFVGLTWRVSELCKKLGEINYEPVCQCRII
jgi:hypothetical protein